MRLTRRQTMKRASEFAMVRSTGLSEAGRFLILSAAPLPAPKAKAKAAPPAARASRFGIITTKRIGHAVVRNLLRRRVREILRAEGAPLNCGLCVVIVVRNRAATADYATLLKDFLKLRQRLCYKLPHDTAC